MATKKKIARTPKRTKRATTPSAGMTLGEVLKERGHAVPESVRRADGQHQNSEKAVEHRTAEQPVDAEIRRAAERAGIPTEEVKPKPELLKCERCGHDRFFAKRTMARKELANALAERFGNSIVLAC